MVTDLGELREDPHPPAGHDMMLDTAWQQAAMAIETAIAAPARAPMTPTNTAGQRRATQHVGHLAPGWGMLGGERVARGRGACPGAA